MIRTAIRLFARILYPSRGVGQSRIAVLGARSAPEETGNQPRALREIKRRDRGWLVHPEREEFYIGYESLIPAGIARVVAMAVVCAVAAAAAAAVVAVMAQQTLPASRFEFGIVRQFTGVLRRSPYPYLETSAGRVWLVGPGKFGAEQMIGQIAEGAVRVSGSLIERSGHRMAEIATIAAMNGPVPEQRSIHRGASEATLQGEVVDSKCYLGVMNPGEGTVHRDCAKRCLSGGIPPMLSVRDAHGRDALIVLVSGSGRPIGRELSAMASRPVVATGRLTRDGEDYVFFADVSAYRTAGRR